MFENLGSYRVDCGKNDTTVYVVNQSWLGPAHLAFHYGIREWVDIAAAERGVQEVIAAHPHLHGEAVPVPTLDMWETREEKIRRIADAIRRDRASGFVGRIRRSHWPAVPSQTQAEGVVLYYDGSCAVARELAADPELLAAMRGLT